MVRVCPEDRRSVATKAEEAPASGRKQLPRTRPRSLRPCQFNLASDCIKISIYEIVNGSYQARARDVFRTSLVRWRISKLRLRKVRYEEAFLQVLLPIVMRKKRFLLPSSLFIRVCKYIKREEELFLSISTD